MWKPSNSVEVLFLICRDRYTVSHFSVLTLDLLLQSSEQSLSASPLALGSQICFWSLVHYDLGVFSEEITAVTVINNAGFDPFIDQFAAVFCKMIFPLLLKGFPNLVSPSPVEKWEVIPNLF